MTLSNVLLTIAIIVAAVILKSSAEDEQKNKCASIKSCSSCISMSFCVWCVTKSKCTKQDCGNDNIIYPDNVHAIMAGPSFCPRVVEPDVRTIKSGTRVGFAVKITQIHLYMAFTPWKCKIIVAGNETVVNAVLLADTVYCDAALLENKLESPVVNGSVSVMWDYSKTFDGTVPIEVCRCDLDPKCSVCK